jgi:hypothetical protein
MFDFPVNKRMKSDDEYILSVQVSVFRHETELLKPMVFNVTGHHA